MIKRTNLGTGLPEMNVLTGCELFTPEGIAKIEETKNAKFVCDTCLRGKRGGWMNSSVAVFWNKDPANIPVGGSAWFGLFYRIDICPPDFKRGPLMITNAISAVETKIVGVMADNGDVIYSRYRHDYRHSPDKTVWIDGGRDYTRYGGGGKFVTLRIVEDKLTIVEAD